MKYIKPSHAAAQTDTDDIQQERPPKTFWGNNSKMMKGILSLLALAFMVTVYVLAHRSFSNRNEAVELQPLSTDQALEVEVLDGAGSMKAAQYVTNTLRLRGYDVVEMKKNNEGMIERSYVIDRSGDFEAAQNLAAILGIAQDKVFQKIDRNLYLNMTVVLGKDYSRLKVFQALNERSKR